MKKNFMSSLVSFIGCLVLLFGFAACEDTVIQGEQGIRGEKGDKGDKGDAGKDGVSPTIVIGENGNWHIDGVDTGVKAQGETGQDGADGKDGTNGKNGADGKDGVNGKDGIDGKDGVDGVGIEKVEYDENGDLKITFTDKSTQKIIMSDKHVHTFGEWTFFSMEDVVCESRLIYRSCSVCDSVEWKKGTYDDHTWSVTTTPPTCQEQGYDTKTCSICGKIEKGNYTQTNEHKWKDTYSFDNSFHWLDCENCDSKFEYIEHDIDNSGYCTVCEQPLLPTEGIVYDVSADGTYAEVIEYTGTATKIKIADTYKDLPIETVYDSVFYGREDIIAVSLPKTLKSIGNEAFRRTGLSEITLPESLTSIGRNAFSECSSLTKIYFNATECRTGLSSYSDYCDYAPFCDTIGFNYENEIAIYISKNVKFIDSCMFTSGNNGRRYSLGCKVYFEEESVCEWIGDCAFYSSDLISINLPSNIELIGARAFSYCALTEITLPSGLTQILSHTFYMSGLQKIAVPEGVKYIESFALAGISSVELPNTLESISEYAFDSWFSNEHMSLQFNEYENCLYLGNKTNPYLLLIAVKNANYSSYKIHSDTKLIFYNAFYNCTRMTSCIIGKYLKYIDAYDDAFPNLAKIYYEGTEQEWTASEIADKIYFKDAEMYYYSEEEPERNAGQTAYDGNYWKYGENNEIVVWVLKEN